MHRAVKEELLKYASPERQAFLPKFFKTGKGEYAEGDLFIGVTVPEQRLIAKRFRNLPFHEIAELLKDACHEARLTALLILTSQYEKADAATKKKIVDFYISHLDSVNNWDLVDLSSYKILGDWLLTHDRKMLYSLAKSPTLWKRRIAIVTTFAFIRKNDFKDTLLLAELLLKDRHDLMHKAVGWMLRELGKRDPAPLRSFLKKHATVMPRTMLRYAIEKFDEEERAAWLSKKAPDATDVVHREGSRLRKFH